jgi:hypothetical protein
MFWMIRVCVRRNTYQVSCKSILMRYFFLVVQCFARIVQLLSVSQTRSWHNDMSCSSTVVHFLFLALTCSSCCICFYSVMCSPYATLAHTNKQTNTQTNKQTTNKQPNKQTDRQTHTQTDRHTQTHTDTHTNTHTHRNMSRRHVRGTMTCLAVQLWCITSFLR